MSYYDTDEVVGIGIWVLISIVLAIPVVNLIGMLYLAFGADNKNLNNFGKAGLILIGIALLFTLLMLPFNVMN